MKKLIFILICAFSSISLISAQTAQNLPYRPYSEFKGDVGAYLKYNFEKRGNLYQGRTVSELLKDVELTPIGYSFMISNSGPSGQTYLNKIAIVFKRKTEGKFNELSDDYLSVQMETPFPWSELLKYYKIYKGKKWTPQDYEVIKDKKIRSVTYRFF